MTEKIRLRCRNCGRRFEAEALTKGEREEARREHIPTSAIRCPDCNRTDTRPGWD